MYIRQIFKAIIFCLAGFGFILQNSCDRKHTEMFDSHLLHADSLCDTNPKSAKAFLEKCALSDFYGKDTLLYRLLCIKSDAKLGIPQTTDVHIKNVLCGFTGTKDVHLLAEIYFYAGIVYRDLENSPEALKYLNDAADVAKNLQDLRLRSNIYSQKGNILISQGLMEMAILQYRESVRLDSCLRDTAGVVLGLRNLAYAYNEVADTLMCKYAMNKAIVLAHKSRLIDIESNIRAQFAGIYANNRQFREARQMLGTNVVEKESADFSPYLYVCSQIYAGLGLQDSLLYYSRMMMRYGDLDAKSFACKNLANVYMARNTPDSAGKYLNLHDRYLDSLQRLDAAEITAKMNAAYNYRSKENELAEEKAENMYRVAVMASVIAFVILMLFVALYILYKLRERNRRQLKSANALQNKLLRQTEEYSRYMEKSIADITAIEMELKSEKNRNFELELILDSKNQLLADISMAKGEKKRECMAMNIIMSSQVYNDIMASLNSRRCLSDDDWQKLDVLTNNVFPGFKLRLASLAKLSVQEYRTCMLLKIGLSIGDIAKLTLRMNNSVSMLRKRLAVKMFGDSCSASDLDAYIKAL